jgi:hypothetical protein
LTGHVVRFADGKTRLDDVVDAIVAVLIVETVHVVHIDEDDELGMAGDLGPDDLFETGPGVAIVVVVP